MFQSRIHHCREFIHCWIWHLTFWLNVNSTDVSVPKSHSILTSGSKWLSISGWPSKFAFWSCNSVKLTHPSATPCRPSSFCANNFVILSGIPYFISSTDGNPELSSFARVQDCESEVARWVQSLGRVDVSLIALSAIWNWIKMILRNFELVKPGLKTEISYWIIWFALGNRRTIFSILYEYL